MANAGAGDAAACGRHAGGMHAGGMHGGGAVAKAGAGVQLHAVGMQACRRHGGGACCGQRHRRGCSCMQPACRRHAGRACRWHAAGACRWGVLWPTPAQGVQLHAVGMQAACRRGMQVVWRLGELCVAERGHGMQAAGRRYAGQSVLDLPKLPTKIEPNLAEFLCEF